MAAAVMIVAAGLLGTVATAQNRAISGTVVDESGAPVVGAAVVVVGNTTIGAVTNVDGTFRLNVPAGANINVSCIGYAEQTVPVGNQTVFRFVLVEDTEYLDETVVIGYGVQRKSDVTGSVASVGADDIKNFSTTDAASALQGKAAGVQILNYSGAPGEGAAIRVRGYSSNSGNIGPLLIVDGLKVDNIQYLDPSMIQSIEILKDAASAAIYGAEACARTNDNDGLQYLNAIQNRAQSKTVSSSLTLDAVKKEKRFEMWMEGCRWPDMVRWSIQDNDPSIFDSVRNSGKNIPSLYDAFWTKNEPTHRIYVEYTPCPSGQEVGFKAGKHEWFPYPFSETSINPNIGQNPGWGGASAE